VNNQRFEQLTVEGGFQGMLSPIKESQGGAFSHFSFISSGA